MEGFHSFIECIEEVVRTRNIATTVHHPPSAFYVIDLRSSPASIHFLVQIDAEIATVIRVVEPAVISTALRLAVTWSRPDLSTAMWTASWTDIPHIVDTGPAIVAWIERMIQHLSPCYEVERRIEEDGREHAVGSVTASWQSGVLLGLLPHDYAGMVSFIQSRAIAPVPIDAEQSDASDDDSMRHVSDALAVIGRMRARVPAWTFDAPRNCYHWGCTQQSNMPVEHVGIKVTASTKTSWQGVAVLVRGTLMLPSDPNDVRTITWTMEAKGRRLLDHWSAMMQWAGIEPARLHEARIFAPTSLRAGVVHLDETDLLLRLVWSDEATSDEDALSKIAQMQQRLG